MPIQAITAPQRPVLDAKSAPLHEPEAPISTQAPEIEDELILNAQPFGREIDREQLVIADVHQPWDIRKFAIVRPSLVIGRVRDQAAFSRELPEHLRKWNTGKTIKYPGENEYSLPASLSQFRETIEQIISFEHAINPHVKHYAADLTVEQGWIYSGQYQRTPNPHRDYAGGTGRFYVVSDCLPTVFYHQTFSFDSLYDPRRAVRQTAKASEWRPKPFEIVAGDQYTIHKGDIAKEKLFRTFLRLRFTNED